jgi:phosphatidate cytidylyltransferase
MSKIVQRLLMFAIGLPLVICVVLVFPQMNHLAVNIIVVIFSSLGALEFNNMISRGNSSLSAFEVLVLGALPAVGAMLNISFGFERNLVAASFLIGAIWLLISRVFSKEETFQNVVERISSGFSIMVYPGLFMIWITRMSLFPESSIIILVFLLMVFACDSLAWFFGMLFGKGNRGFIPASPNKSIAGFIGGIAGSILVGVGAVHFFPEIFTSNLIESALLSGILLGFTTCAAAILGDLAESVMKRSSNIKDSGNVIPGRGGVLDSIDSISLAAPVFYALFTILFT